jgi:hypothetical protein
MEVIVAGDTKPGDALFDFFAFKFAFIAFICMARARNEVVPREQ